MSCMYIFEFELVIELCSSTKPPCTNEKQHSFNGPLQERHILTTWSCTKRKLGVVLLFGSNLMQGSQINWCIGHNHPQQCDASWSPNRHIIAKRCTHGRCSHHYIGSCYRIACTCSCIPYPYDFFHACYFFMCVKCIDLDQQCVDNYH